MTLIRNFAGIFMSFLSLAANAATVNMVYDERNDITWLADGNYALTSGYAEENGLLPDGRMKWQDALNWAEQLSIDGHSDWRLPSAMDANGETCQGFNCADNELGHLFYNIVGATAGQRIETGDPDQLALFTNIQSLYWTSTESASNPGNAWTFSNTDGWSGTINKFQYFYAWAVHPGNLTASNAPPIPIPATLWLMTSALVGFGFFCNRRTKIPGEI